MGDVNELKEGTGLVLAGGGGKGIYQVGILKSLAEAGYLDNIVAASGSSIGGINAVLFSEGLAEGGISRAITQMEEAWDDMDFGVLFDVDEDSIRAGEKRFSRNETKRLIDKYLTYELLEKAIDLYITGAKCPSNMVTGDIISQEEMNLLWTLSTEETYKDFSAEYFRLNDKSCDFVKQAILATSALPVIYAPVEVDGNLYVDGGLKDNVPIKPLYDMGIRKFIVIELSMKSAIKQEDYPDAEIIDIVPSADLGKLVSGTLNFDKQDKAVKKYFAELEGKRYIKTLFEKDETYIEIQDSLARLDFEAAKKKAEYETKYDQLSSSVNRNFDYINKLEESLKKLDQ